MKMRLCNHCKKILVMSNTKIVYCSKECREKDGLYQLGTGEELFYIHEN